MELVTDLFKRGELVAVIFRIGELVANLFKRVELVTGLFKREELVADLFKREELVAGLFKRRIEGDFSDRIENHTNNTCSIFLPPLCKGDNVQGCTSVTTGMESKSDLREILMLCEQSMQIPLVVFS